MKFLESINEYTDVLIPLKLIFYWINQIWSKITQWPYQIIHIVYKKINKCLKKMWIGLRVNEF